MSAQFAHTVEEALVEAVTSEAKAEGKLVLVNFRDRGVNPLVAELAALTVAVTMAAGTIVKGSKGEEELAAHREQWLKAVAEALDAAIRIKQGRFSTPEMPKEVKELLDKLSRGPGAFFGMDQAKREVLSAVVAGDECPGCGEVHDIDDDERAGIQAELDSLNKTIN